MQTFRGQVQALVSQAVDAVLPPRCAVTGDIVPHQGQISPEAWGALDFIAAPFCAACGIPFDFEVEGEALCTSCLDDPPPFETARAALKYSDASRDLILGFKHADKTYAAVSFTPWLRRAGAEMLEEAGCLVPVPLHRWRLVARRYNQAALIAGFLAADTGIPLILDALVRIRPTPSQGHLSAKDRHRNVRGAFAFNPRYRDAVKDKTIVLIDDVYTTGATAGECAKVLLKTGAAKVHVLTLARVSRPGFY